MSQHWTYGRDFRRFFAIWPSLVYAKYVKYGEAYTAPVSMANSSLHGDASGRPRVGRAAVGVVREQRVVRSLGPTR